MTVSSATSGHSSYIEIWRRLLPEGVVASECVPTLRDLQLHPEEEPLAADFGPMRLTQFAAGRRCARAAMKELAGAQAAVGAEGRRPVWPEGLVGSISHTEDYCAAAVASAESVVGLGIDVERARTLKEEVAQRITSADELERLPEVGRLDWATVLFSAKESFYKLQNPISDVFLGFRDVRVELGSDGSLELVLLKDVGAWPAGRAFQGRYHRGDAHVLTAFALSS